MMWIDLRKSNVQLRHACVEITAPVIELFPQAASSSILAKSSDSAADPVGAAGWVMGVHSAATSQPHRHDRMPQLLEVHREGGTEGERERRWGEQEWRETERTLGITGAWIDLVIQSIRWGLRSVHRSGRACSGKNKFANNDKRESQHSQPPW